MTLTLRSPRVRAAVEILAMAAAYWLAARLALLLAIPPGYATAVWPSAGIALAGFLLFGHRLWPGVVLGSFLANFGTSLDASSAAALLRSAPLPLAIGAGAALQAAAGAYLVRRYSGGRDPLATEGDILRLLLLGGPVSCLLSATLGVLSLRLAGLIQPADAAFSWWTWWVGDTIGVVLVAPLLLLWRMGPRGGGLRRKLAVSAPLFLTFVLVVIFFIFTSRWEQQRIRLESERRTDALEPYLAAHPSWQAWSVLTGGLLFTSLLGAFLLVATGRAAETEHLVGLRTAELRQANEDLRFEMEERRRAEQSLARQAEELRRSNAELERFAYVASHDLQEPLRMVTSYVQLLQQRFRGRLDPEADEFIDYAVSGSRRMHQLLIDLLAYSRISTRPALRAPVNLETGLERALENLHLAIAEAGASVSHDPLPTAVADETQIIQLFQNLIGNAVKFRAAAPPRIHVRAALRGHEWLVAVSDNGIGIEPQYQERIFAVFQRLHGYDQYPGTGIGLAICKRIVNVHGGSIWAESTPGEGSTFWFTLPA